MNEWYFPITLLPGVGLLIMSTSSLSMGLSNELTNLLNTPDSNHDIIRKKISQLSRLNRALTAFYISCAALVISGLINGLYGEAHSLGPKFSEILLFFSIVCILLALTQLMIYAAKAVSIKRTQYEERL
ncbi:MAG: hypothetical protein R8G66_08030 [Cytophagales bacterium]|nr:hypothetical protein [Cytophagales bacterium]